MNLELGKSRLVCRLERRRGALASGRKRCCEGKYRAKHLARLSFVVTDCAYCTCRVVVEGRRPSMGRLDLALCLSFCVLRSWPFSSALLSLEHSKLLANYEGRFASYVASWNVPRTIGYADTVHLAEDLKMF